MAAKSHGIAGQVSGRFVFALRASGGTRMSRDYGEVAGRIRAVCAGEDDAVALMATVACELYHAFDDFDWVGFYRVTGPELLKIGPTRAGTAAWSSRSRAASAAPRRARAGPRWWRTSTPSPATSPAPPAPARRSWCRCSGRTATLIGVLDVDSDRPAAFERDRRGGARGWARSSAARPRSVAEISLEARPAAAEAGAMSASPPVPRLARRRRRADRRRGAARAGRPGDPRLRLGQRALARGDRGVRRRDQGRALRRPAGRRRGRWSGRRRG